MSWRENIREGFESMKEGCRVARSKVSNISARISGKAVYNQACSEYEKLKTDCNSFNKKHEKFIEKAELNIHKLVTDINKYRINSATGFDRFERLASMFASWEVAAGGSEKAKKTTSKKLKIKSQEDLFTIDFNKHPFKTTFQAAITLGFLTRKKAKKTLENVRRERGVFDVEKKKLIAEKKRIEKLQAALEQIVYYFEHMTGFYDDLLSELEYAVRSLQSLYFQRDCKFIGDRKMDCYFLPKRHLLCLMVAEQTTRIVQAMSTKRYLTAKFALLEADITAANQLHNNSLELKKHIDQAA